VHQPAKHRTPSAAHRAASALRWWSEAAAAAEAHSDATRVHGPCIAGTRGQSNLAMPTSNVAPSGECK